MNTSKMKIEMRMRALEVELKGVKSMLKQVLDGEVYYFYSGTIIEKECSKMLHSCDGVFSVQGSDVEDIPNLSYNHARKMIADGWGAYDDGKHAIIVQSFSRI